MATRAAAQSPAGRPMVPTGSRVVIVVSRGPAPAAPVAYTTVPDLANVQQGDALGRLQEAGLETRVFNDYSPRVGKGRVMGQLPVAGTSLPQGATQVLLVSSGSAEVASEVPLPDVVGLPEAQAIETLERGRLSPQVAHDFSPTVPAGTVFGQLPDPATLSIAKSSSPPMWIWIVVGVVLIALAALAYAIFGREVTVPEVTGIPVAEAEQRIEEAGLVVGEVTAEETSEAEQGTVLDQNPDAGATVRRGAEVDLIVAGAIPNVEVPGVIGTEEDEAVATLEEAGFVVAATNAPSDSVAKGNVISQTPGAGQSVPPGTTVGIVVSSGVQVQNVAVPNVVGLTRQDAESALEDAGLRFIVAENPSAEVAEGVVMSQLPAAGDSVAQGTTIGIEVSSGPPADASTVPVPDVVGKPLAEAQNMLAGAGFESLPVSVNETGKPQNEIVAQTPEADEDVSAGSTVVIFYSSGQ